MTTHTKKPDYSSVPEMRYDCINTNDRKYLINKLLQYKVSVIAYSTKEYIKHYSALAFIHGHINDCVSKDKSEAIHTWVTSEQFLAPFQKIYNDWKFTKQANEIIDRATRKKYTKSPLLVPTEEEIEIWTNQKKDLMEACIWMRDKIIELNK